MEVLGIWIAALLTLCIYSFLYKDNPFYKMAEHIYVGVSTGYLVVVSMGDALYRDVWEPLFVNDVREYIVIIPTALSLMMFMRFHKKLTWMSRYAIAFIVGIGAGVAIPNNVQSYLLIQTEATIVPILTTAPWSDSAAVIASVKNFLVLIGVLTVLFYFFFSVKHEGVLKPVSRTGVIYLMLFFGASFGYTVMGRVSLLIGRMRFLLLDWIGPYFGAG
jgi:hypothetical protein